MTTGIYKIENLLNGKIYIGQSIHIERRWQQHCQLSADSLIANAIKKYGKENFSFQIIEECDESLLNNREMFYIQQYDSLVPNGYNIYPLRQVKDFSKKVHYCVDCGKEIGKGAIRCRSCADIAQQLCDRPSREELKALIRTTSFVQIGEQYKVTDNAIKKWCKKYGLPSRKTDIKQYSDEEWQKI